MSIERIVQRVLPNPVSNLIKGAATTLASSIRGRKVSQMPDATPPHKRSGKFNDISLRVEEPTKQKKAGSITTTVLNGTPAPWTNAVLRRRSSGHGGGNSAINSGANNNADVKNQPAMTNGSADVLAAAKLVSDRRTELNDALAKFRVKLKINTEDEIELLRDKRDEANELIDYLQQVIGSGDRNQLKEMDGIYVRFYELLGEISEFPKKYLSCVQKFEDSGLSHEDAVTLAKTETWLGNKLAMLKNANVPCEGISNNYHRDMNQLIYTMKAWADCSNPNSGNYDPARAKFNEEQARNIFSRLSKLEDDIIAAFEASVGTSESV